MKKLILTFLLLAGCTYWQTPPSPRFIALDAINYGLSHKAPSNYCFDCDMRKHNVPNTVIRQWHEVIADQLSSRDLYRDEYITVTHTLPELASQDTDWYRYVNRVVDTLAARDDMKYYAGPKGSYQALIAMANVRLHVKQCMSGYHSCY